MCSWVRGFECISATEVKEVLSMLWYWNQCSAMLMFPADSTRLDFAPQLRTSRRLQDRSSMHQAAIDNHKFVNSATRRTINSCLWSTSSCTVHFFLSQWYRRGSPATGSLFFYVSSFLSEQPYWWSYRYHALVLWHAVAKAGKLPPMSIKSKEEPRGWDLSRPFHFPLDVLACSLKRVPSLSQYRYPADSEGRHRSSICLSNEDMKLLYISAGSTYSPQIPLWTHLSS